MKTSTMLAAIVHAKGDLRLEQVPIPDVPRDSIRVKVHTCSICGTDLRIYRKGDYRAAYPVITGHEIAGVVEAVGADVQSVKEGERVCVAPGHGCGACRLCRAGHPNVCVTPFPSLGYKVNGGFAEYIAVPANIFKLGFVNPIPSNLSFDQASMSEITACCLNAQNNSPVHAGDVVLIMGAGPAGMIHAILARHKGAKKILLTQRSRERLELVSSKIPVDRIVASREEDLEQAVREETNGEGADVIFVCAPSREAQETACQLIAPRGRVNFFGGLPKDDCIVQIDANTLHYKEFFIAGASSSLPEGNREALRLLSEKIVGPDLLITHRFPLQDIHTGFDVVESRQGIKVIINP
jgi:L-iditol 2-dehydrogenase